MKNGKWNGGKSWNDHCLIADFHQLASAKQIDGDDDDGGGSGGNGGGNSGTILIVCGRW